MFSSPAEVIHSMNSFVLDLSIVLRLLRNNISFFSPFGETNAKE